MIRSQRAFLTALAMIAVLAAPVAADDDDIVPTIAVAGDGEARAKPDAAEVRLAAVAQAKTARDAMAHVSAATERLLAAIKGHRVADADIQTEAVSLNPVFRQRKRGEEGTPPIIGYRARLGQRVVLRDLERLGDLLDGAVKAGAEGIGGVRFFVVDEDALRDQARRAAVADATHAAPVLALAAGAELGAILSISEGGAGPGPRSRALAMAAQNSRVPVAPGQIVTRARGQIVYILKSGN